MCNCSLQFRLGNLDSKRDWGHAKDYVEVSCAPLKQTEGRRRGGEWEGALNLHFPNGNGVYVGTNCSCLTGMGMLFLQF